MPVSATVGAFTVVPSNELAASIQFWERLGFERTGGDANYAIMTGWDCEVHLTQAGDGAWRVRQEAQPNELLQSELLGVRSHCNAAAGPATSSRTRLKISRR